MKEGSLVWLAALCSVVGVATLCLSSTSAQTKQVELSTVSQSTVVAGLVTPSSEDFLLCVSEVNLP